MYLCPSGVQLSLCVCPFIYVYGCCVVSCCVFRMAFWRSSMRPVEFKSINVVINFKDFLINRRKIKYKYIYIYILFYFKTHYCEIGYIIFAKTSNLEIQSEALLARFSSWWSKRKDQIMLISKLGSSEHDVKRWHLSSCQSYVCLIYFLQKSTESDVNRK